MSTDTILGINPGTRFIGIAVISNGVLVHAQIRAFHGAWSHKKLKKILQWFESIIGKYHVVKVIVKTPDIFPSSRCYNRLTGALNVFFACNKLKPRYYTTSEIMKRHCVNNPANRTELLEWIAQKYPELTLEFKKEKRNKNAHFYRLFEAVAAALM